MSRPDDVDERVDLESRERVVMLEHRYRRALRAVFVGMLVLGVATVLAIIGVLSALGVQHESRIRAIREVCTAQNATNAGIATFVHHVAPKLAPEVAADFPIVRDCEAYARRLAK